MSKKKELVIIFSIFFFLSLVLFKDFIFKGLIPMPADTVVGGYYPWKDEVWMERTAGFPIKNFTIRDITRQLYPWRKMFTDSLKSGNWPLWNPYNFTGTPHLANIFSAGFYPLNIIFFLKDFAFAWGFYVFLQPFLISMAMYLFLKNLKLRTFPSFLGSIVFAYSSFLMIRMEFGMVGHTAFWLPLSLLAIDKYYEQTKKKWWFLAVVCLSCSVLAGYLQVTIYSFVLFLTYVFFRFSQNKKIKPFIFLTLIPIISLFLTSIQVLPLFDLVKSSSRLSNYGKDQFFAQEFFLPFERLITFLVPDFFGNDAAGNFWGKISYYEFSGYIGIIPIFFTFFSLFFLKKNKNILFWLIVLLVSFLVLLPNPLIQFIYNLKIPGLSVLVPARAIFVVDFCLSILTAFGLEMFMQSPKNFVFKKRIFLSICLLFFLFLLIFIYFFYGYIFFPEFKTNVLVTVRNSVLPLGSVFLLFIGLPLYLRLKKKNFSIILITFFLYMFFCLLRNSWKYNPFLPKQIIFPTTKVLDYLKNDNSEKFRILITHQELMTANFNMMYNLEMIDGYDSFHYQRFEELALTGNTVDPERRFASPGRNLFLTNYKSPVFDLMNVKYVLSIEEIDSAKLQFLFQEGKTRIYKNLNYYPRVFLTNNIEILKTDEEILEEIINFTSKGERKIILEEDVGLVSSGKSLLSEAIITKYSPNKVEITTKSDQETFLFLADAYDSGWKAYINDVEIKVYRANFNFRAVRIPSGEQKILFKYEPTSFKNGKAVSLVTFIVLCLLFVLDLKLPLLKKKRM